MKIMISTTSNALVQRRGSLIQRRNSKRFVLSELSSAAASIAAESTLAKDTDTLEKDEYLSVTDFEGSDDDDTFKVPDIVLDIHPVSASPINYCIDPTETAAEVPEWRTLKSLKNNIV